MHYVQMNDTEYTYAVIANLWTKTTVLLVVAYVTSKIYRWRGAR